MSGRGIRCRQLGGKEFFILNKDLPDPCVTVAGVPVATAASVLEGGESVVTTTEIAPEIYRLAVFVPEINLAFSHFLVRDDERISRVENLIMMRCTS